MNCYAYAIIVLSFADKFQRFRKVAEDFELFRSDRTEEGCRAKDKQQHWKQDSSKISPNSEVDYPDSWLKRQEAGLNNGQNDDVMQCNDKGCLSCTAKEIPLLPVMCIVTQDNIREGFLTQLVDMNMHQSSVSIN